MNIHCIVTSTILLSAAVQTLMASAQRGWDNYYHRHYVGFDLPFYEIRHPDIFEVRNYVDDDGFKSQGLHLSEASGPIIYLPKIRLIAPDVYVEHRHPFAMEQPINAPFRCRLQSTLQLSFKTKILPLHYPNDESKGTDGDSVGTDTKPDKDTKPDASKKPNTTKKPDATKKPEPTKKPDATKKPEATKKPAATKNSEPTKKPEAVTKEEDTSKLDGKTPENNKKQDSDFKSEPDPNLEKEPDTTNVSENETNNVVDTVDEVLERPITESGSSTNTETDDKDSNADSIKSDDKITNDAVDNTTSN